MVSSPPPPSSRDQWSADEADWLADTTGRDDSTVFLAPGATSAGTSDPARTTSAAASGKNAKNAKNANTPKSRKNAAAPTTGASTTSAAGAPPLTRKERSAAKRAKYKAAKQARRRRPLWRGRILPKTVLGMSLLMLAAGFGAAAAGTALYMNYQYRRDQSDALVKTFPQRAKIAVDTVNAEAINARRRIQDEIEPIRKLAATGDTLRDLLAATSASVWQVSTVDVNGATAVGSAFVVASDSTRSFLLTSYELIAAATARPGPDIKVRKGSEVLDAELWTWQEKRDLALLIVKKPSLPRLEWAISTDVRLGQQVFAVSGVGTAGGSITQGFIANVDADGVQHTAPLGQHFRGGPIITDRGAVIAIASRAYEPLGFPSDGVYFAPPIRSACETVLKCPATEVTGTGQVTGSGAQR